MPDWTAGIKYTDEVDVENRPSLRGTLTISVELLVENRHDLPEKIDAVKDIRAAIAHKLYGDIRVQLGRLDDALPIKSIRVQETISALFKLVQ